MQSFIRKVVSLDQQSITLGSKRAKELGLSFSSLVRLLINMENAGPCIDKHADQAKRDLKESSNA